MSRTAGNSITFGVIVGDQGATGGEVIRGVASRGHTDSKFDIGIPTTASQAIALETSIGATFGASGGDALGGVLDLRVGGQITAIINEAAPSEPTAIRVGLALSAGVQLARGRASTHFSLAGGSCR